MPFTPTLVIALIAVVLGIAIWFKTRRIGPVVGVALAAFVLVAVTDQSLLAAGGQAVADGFTWFFSDVLSF